MKTLIISHTPISTENNMGKTLYSLFECFEEVDLCQLYVYPSMPNIKKCGSYFRMTDKEVLKSIVKRNTCGKRVFVNQSKNDEKSYIENKMFSKKEKNLEFKLIVRSLIWKFGKWNTKKFKEWMNEEKPDVIFAAVGVSSFIYSVIRKISKIYNLPVVTYICDDFYFSSYEKKTLFSKIYYPIFRKNTRRLLIDSSKIVSICDDLTTAYSNKFGVSAITLYTGTKIEITNCHEVKSNNILRFFGNINLNRNISLSQIGKTLDDINRERNTNFVLEIYTNANYQESLAVFNGIRSVKICNFVSAEQVKKLMREACLLLHVESFLLPDISRVRYSVSTKIAESLASGVCLFAYGPQSVASIHYLLEHRCAFLATDVKELKDTLLRALFDTNEKQKVIDNAIILAKSNHDAEKQSKKLQRLLNEVVNESIAGKLRV